MRCFVQVTKKLSHHVVATDGDGLVRATTACGQEFVLLPNRLRELRPEDVTCGHCRRSPRYVGAGGPPPPPYRRKAA